TNSAPCVAWQLASPEPTTPALARAGARVHPRGRVRRGDAEKHPSAQGRALGEQAANPFLTPETRARRRRCLVTKHTYRIPAIVWSTRSAKGARAPRDIDSIVLGTKQQKGECVYAAPDSLGWSRSRAVRVWGGVRVVRQG